MRPGRAVWLFALLVSVPPGLLFGQASTGIVETPFVATSIAGLRADISALLLFGVGGGELPMAATAWPELDEGDDSARATRVRLVVELEGLSLIEAKSELESSYIELYVYALDSEGQVSAHLAQRVRIDLDRWRQPLIDHGLRWSDRLEISQNVVSLRILAMDPDTGQYGLRILPLTHPLPASAENPREPTLWGPWIFEPAEPWLRVRGSNEEIVLGDLPSAMPVAMAGQTLEASLWARYLPKRSKLRAELKSSDDGSGIEELEVSVLDRQSLTDRGVERLLVHVEMPEVPTGSYRIAFLAGGRAVQHSSSLDLFLLAGIDIDGPLAWSRLRSATSRDKIPSPEVRSDQREQPSQRKRTASLRRTTKKRYTKSLRLLSSGKRRSALRELVAFEGEAGLSDDDLGRIRQLELELDRGLAEEEREVLLPISLLHLDAYREHRRRRQFLPAAHSRQMILELASLWMQLDDRETSRRQAADVLVCLSFQLMDSELRQAAREVLRQASILAPDHETAGLQLALSYEKAALYEEAISALKDLVDQHSKIPEARLRLAVNLARGVQSSRSSEIFRRLLDEHNEAWILAVAYEESARLELAAGREDEALALLSKARSRLPNQQSILLLSAHILDRRGRPEEANVLLAQLPPGSLPSHRYRYSHSPRPAIYERLAPQSSARLAHLARALEATEGGQSRR